MNTILRWDPMSRTRWNPLKDRDELESRLATRFAGREATGNGGQEAVRRHAPGAPPEIRAGETESH